MKKKGFNLIELVVVMALVGILASATWPSINDFRKTYQFSNSIEIFDSYLGKGFSESRSKSEEIRIQGVAGESSFSFNGETVFLFGNTTFTNNFEVEFIPPLGDIATGSSTSITLLNGKKQAQFTLHLSSGLIDTKVSTVEELEVENNDNEIDFEPEELELSPSSR